MLLLLDALNLIHPEFVVHLTFILACSVAETDSHFQTLFDIRMDVRIEGFQQHRIGIAVVLVLEILEEYIRKSSKLKKLLRENEELKRENEELRAKLAKPCE